MSTDATTERETRWAEIVPEVPQPPTNLVFDDGEPLESNRHRIAINVLIDRGLLYDMQAQMIKNSRNQKNKIRFTRSLFMSKTA